MAGENSRGLFAGESLASVLLYQVYDGGAASEILATSQFWQHRGFCILAR